MNKENKGEIKVTTKVQRWGNSLAVRLPKVILDDLNIKEGSDISISVENNAIKIIPIKKKPTLEELMSKITPENKHDEVNWGKPEGAEIW
ncbi:AbrB/MazE/SpoVT family DNA-binding domain-containing protein [Caldifermentibacillus hisashii]|uniref:AbrB/MazE/SpoVT family DNA-binding domain-containing protein n=1 Tax=Caldifermentibacillus hisashii TaxID=996558 RepID=UPI0031B75C3F